MINLVKKLKVLALATIFIENRCWTLPCVSKYFSKSCPKTKKIGKYVCQSVFNLEKLLLKISNFTNYFFIHLSNIQSLSDENCTSCKVPKRTYYKINTLEERVKDDQKEGKPLMIGEENISAFLREKEEQNRLWNVTTLTSKEIQGKKLGLIITKITSFSK